MSRMKGSRTYGGWGSYGIIIRFMAGLCSLPEIISALDYSWDGKLMRTILFLLCYGPNVRIMWKCVRKGYFFFFFY